MGFAEERAEGEMGSKSGRERSINFRMGGCRIYRRAWAMAPLSSARRRQLGGSTGEWCWSCARYQARRLVVATRTGHRVNVSLY